MDKRTPTHLHCQPRKPVFLASGRGPGPGERRREGRREGRGKGRGKGRGNGRRSRGGGLDWPNRRDKLLELALKAPTQLENAEHDLLDNLLWDA